MKKLTCAVLSAMVCFAVALFGACKKEAAKQPEKLKDGIALVLTEGESRSIDLTEYISVEGTEYGFTAESSSPETATVSVDGGTATVTAVAKGNAVVSVSAGEAHTEFAVTVNETQAPPVAVDKTALIAELALEITEQGNYTYESYSIYVEKLNAAKAVNKKADATQEEVDAACNALKAARENLTRVPEGEVVIKKPEVTHSVDIYMLGEKTQIKIDFTGNVDNNGAENVVYSVSLENTAVTLDGENCYVYNLNGEYTDVPAKAVFNVTVSYGEGKSAEYIYTLSVTDTTACRVINGGFDNGLEGWTMTGGIGEISENSTFWDQKFPIFNNGKYFSGNDTEAATGTLESSAFKVGGLNKITFMLGAAGNRDCYITLEKTDGTVVALWRNTKFKDVGNWDRDEIGKTQFACNLATYVADLSEHAGETLKIVLHDNASEGFGFFNFDELTTYYAAEEELPQNAFAAENLLADKSALQTVLENALTEQGDYTAESYDVYVKGIALARAVLENIAADQKEVDAAKTAVEKAFAALELRVPEEIAEADKSFSLLVGNSKELNLHDYVDGKDLSNLTYEITAPDGKVTVSVEDETFTVTAGSEEAESEVNIAVKYKGDTVLTVTIKVTVTSESAPVLKAESVKKEIDLYSAENKTDVTIDFAANVENVGGLELGYTVTLDGGELALDGTKYTYTFGSYTEAATEKVFAVKVEYNLNGTADSLEYNYTLSIKDTRAYRLANGGFDSGDLTGWTLSNQKLGAVSNETHYWKNDPESEDGFVFGLDGEYMFSAYADGAEEGASGTLISSDFIIGGSGYITYKLGGAKNVSYVYIDVIEKSTGKILGRFGNTLWQERTDGAKSGCTLIAYKADLSAHIGKTAYIRISDYACVDYGLFFADSFVTYYEQQPEGFNAAVALGSPENIANEIINGDFETGDFTGWTILTDGMNDGICADETWWGERGPYNKTGKFHLDGWKTGIDEANAWAVRSSEFTLGGSGYISVRMGGNAAAVKVYKANGELIGVYKSTHFSDVNFPFVGDGEGKGSWADMRKYYIDLSAYIGEKLYIELHDTGAGAWAQAFFDESVTYYKDVPDVANGYDTVTAPVSRDENNNLVYGEVILKWRLAVKEN